jgi:ferredoxin-NADP reductase
VASELQTSGIVTEGRIIWRLGMVVETVVETPRAKTLVLDIPDWPGHLPGQHIDVRLTAPDGYQAQRSYSIASPPEDERLQLTVDRLPDGEVSPYLTDELRAGDQLELRGPIGRYFTWTVAQGGPLVLVGGGSGVAPLMAMLRHRAAASSAIPATLLYSSRTFVDIIYRDELDRLAAHDPALQVIHTLTREQPPGWSGYHRRIDRALLAETVGALAPGTRAFVCGPTRLVETVATDLLTLGYPANQIKTERFGPTGG